MCKVILNHLKLGARELGWEVWDGRQVIELTSNQIIKAIQNGETIRGLQIGNNGNLEPDESFFTTNIMEKAHIGNCRPMFESVSKEISINTFYIILGCEERAGKKVYQAITTRFAREDLPEEKLRTLYELGIISAGVKIEGEKIILPAAEEVPTKSKKK